MQFLKTLFWVVDRGVRRDARQPQLARRDAQPVGRHPGRHQDPGAAVPVFLLGFLPTCLIYRARNCGAAASRLEVARAASSRPTLRSADHDADERAGRMNPIFVAIDTPDLDRAQALAEAVGADAGGLKLGLEFFSRQRPGRSAAIWRAWACRSSST